MQRDYPLDPADTLVIRRFLKLRPAPKIGEGVYKTNRYIPPQILLDNAWELVGRSKLKPEKWYFRPPTPAVGPFPVAVRIPSDEAILALASELVAGMEEWWGKLGMWWGRFEPDGPRSLCGTVMMTMSEEDQRLARSPILSLFLGVWSMALRWPDGFDAPPEWMRHDYYSQLEPEGAP